MNEWHPSRNTLESISHQTNLLIEQFPLYIQAFDKAFQEDRSFAGPSLYFHYQCIRQFGDASVREKLESHHFLEYLYATLTSWGMHRMGNTATKLRNFSEFITQILAQQERLAELEKLNIWTLTESEAGETLELLIAVLEGMSISKSDAHLVANTKVIHHILPNLMPPVDRQYTLAFFGINKTLPSNKPAGTIFAHLFPAFIQISSHLESDIQTQVNIQQENWHSSFTKVIDNAIIGSFV